MDSYGSDWELPFSWLFSFRLLPPLLLMVLKKWQKQKDLLRKGESWKFWKHAPLLDYNIPWIKNKKVSTALSGLIGTLAIFFIALGIGKLIKKTQRRRLFFSYFFLLLFLSPPLTPTLPGLLRQTMPELWKRVNFN